MELRPHVISRKELTPFTTAAGDVNVYRWGLVRTHATISMEEAVVGG